MKKSIIYSALSLAFVGSSIVFAQSVSDNSVDIAEMPILISPAPIVCEAPGVNLRLGDGVRNKKSDEVKKLQKVLIERGHLKSSATGYFGPLTLSAVKSFQKENGVSTTGFVGPLTLGKAKEHCQKPKVVCDYAMPPEGCKYVPGENYDKESGCGMMLKCGDSTTFEPPTNCQSWNDGCNICSRQTPDGPAMCTKRACIGAYMMQAKCTSYFDTGKTCSALGKTYKEGESTSCIDINGQTACIADATHVCRNGEWKIEGGYPYIKEPPVACTMEARLCADGSMMPRDNKCGWHPEQCPSATM